MADEPSNLPDSVNDGAPIATRDPGDQEPVAPLTESEFEAAFSEPLSQTLDLDTWHPGADLPRLYRRLQDEVADAVRKEAQYLKEIRRVVFPRLRNRPSAPKDAGVYSLTTGQVEAVHRKLLFNGAVEACDGTVSGQDTLPVTITQIGVCLVSYRGDQGSWVHRLYRRDLRASGANPVDETLELLDRRRARGGQDQPSIRDRMSDLARRGIMAYAERAVLLDRSSATWRMGHGNPVAYELVTGSGMPELLRASLALLRRLILDHKKFVFVPSAPRRRELLTIGNALNPLEYAIVDTIAEPLGRIVSGHYRGQEWGELGKDAESFAKECGPQVVMGLYRASRLSPCQMFYGHVEHAHEAAIIAIADSLLQEHRGFPMLIDLADGLCRTTFGSDTFSASAQLAYAEAGEPFRYLAERKTRR